MSLSLSPAPTPPVRPSLVRRALRWTMPVLVLAFAAGLWQRERLWVWYCAERLERAADGDRGAWADKLADVGEPAVPTLLALFRHDDPGVCAAAKKGLVQLAGAWPADDPRRLAFARQFVEAEPRFSTPGRSAALELLPLVLAGGDAEVAQKAKGMVATAAKSESIDVRIQAVAAALRPEVDALEAIVPLITDPDAGVRRAAVLALGPVRDGTPAALPDDELLRCLHDPDAEVQRLCEMGLRSRGRSPRDIRLGRRYAAPDAAERQKLLLDLANDDELDVAVWLERLTADPDPAVRAGAVRVAVERRADLGDRLEQMSQSDPDATVRRIAAYYRSKMVAGR
jgi:HEAT repeat protein